MTVPPPLLLGISTAYWGLYCDQLVLSLLIAAILEGLPLLNHRLNFTTTDLRRILLYSVVGLIVVSGYFFATRSAREALMELLQWLPLVVLPMVLAQRVSSLETLDWRRLVPLLASPIAAAHQRPLVLSLGYPYMVVCLLAASTANWRSFWFYLGIVVICGWGLWSQRSRRHAPFFWVVCFVLAAGLGVPIHMALNHFQHVITDATVELLIGDGMQTDPYRSTTRLGHLGTLKLSDRILLRVFTESRLSPPLLLHRASYDRYLYGQWIAKDAKLRTMTPDREDDAWTFSRRMQPSKKVLISEYLEGGVAVLALPPGTLQLRELPVAELKGNRLGTVQVKDEEKLVTYEAFYDPTAVTDSKTTQYDLKVPPKELALLSQIAADLGAGTLSKHQFLEKVRTFFNQGFAYSLTQTNSTGSGNVLQEFLTKTRYGHCEHFATATVLLLRSAGIPARYATGFSVQEYSEREEAYVVRLRHAHAWARANVDGTWIDLDTTPSVWADVEQDNASLWQPLMDLGSWLWFKYATWRIGDSGDLFRSLFIASLVVATGLLLWWLRRKRIKLRPKTEMRSSIPLKTWPGRDSEFPQIEHALRRSGLARQRGEPLYAWIERISPIVSTPSDQLTLLKLAALHYHYRFAPNGLSPNQRFALADGVRDWLERNEHKLPVLLPGDNYGGSELESG